MIKQKPKIQILSFSKQNAEGREGSEGKERTYKTVFA